VIDTPSRYVPAVTALKCSYPTTVVDAGTSNVSAVDVIADAEAAPHAVAFRA
jgi:hypothetical protein